MNDQRARSEALTPDRSFIIQAPAGSGKTELLTQRLLALLAHVKQPEHIIAITFTRKAANEMRTRVLDALAKASAAPPSDHAHALKTWTLAQAVLKQHETQDWELLKNPNRLRIQTIDAFCASLTAQSPILSHLGGCCHPSDHPDHLYHQALQVLWKGFGEQAWTPALARLLALVDNRYATLEKLLISLLAKREQWLFYLGCETKDLLEHHLNQIVDHHERKLSNTLSFEQKETLKKILCYLKKPNNWPSMAALLLTKEGAWRRSFTARLGFPASKTLKTKVEKEEVKAIKEQLKQLIIEFEENDLTFRGILFETFSQPNRHYSETEWEVLDSLFEILPTCAALLQLVFRQHRATDFTEIALSALAALGQSQTPTDLALKLDHQIHHILVDEFQDTSLLQFRLLEKLVGEWQPNDGRTLFLVGDPMQSIYAFRQAEVALFSKAKASGIGPVPLNFLALETNFRSNESIIDWINRTFQPAFEKTGAIPYHPSTAFHTNRCASKITHHRVSNPTEEAALIVQMIQAQQNDNSIAILVRSRTHLKAILSALHQEGIAFQALEIEAIHQQMIYHDLLSLTKALLFIHDRKAWLSILRAPFCGLTLDDLLIVSQNDLIFESLSNPDHLKHVSEDGQMRLKKIHTVMQHALNNRQRQTLRDALETVWKQLSGPECLEEINHFHSATQFFDLLEKLEQGGELSDLSFFEKKLASLHLNHESNATVHIMTIHKAKGLEFDHVILPGLHRRTQSDTKDLLLWQESLIEEAESGLVMAPLSHRSEGVNPTYAYLAKERQKKREAEALRLFYVAATRAKQHLSLIAELDYEENAENDQMEEIEATQPIQATLKPPAKSSLLFKVWETTQHAFTLTNVQKIDQYMEQNEAFKRLKPHFFQDHSVEIQETKGSNPTEKLLITDSTARFIGKVTHRILQWIHHEGIEQWPLARLESVKPIWKQSLRRLGVVQEHLESSYQIVKTAIANTLSDPKGRWLLAPRAITYSEYQIAEPFGHRFKQNIIDLFFIENNEGWIVDYKTIQPNPNDIAPETFDQHHTKLYAPQLQRYARCIRTRHPDLSKIHLALYFPLQKKWLRIPNMRYNARHERDNELLNSGDSF